MDTPAHSFQSNPDSLESLRWLLSTDGQLELADVAARMPLQPSEVIRIRQRLGVSRATQVFELAPQLDAAAVKLGVAGCLATDRGLQQATDHWIANYKSSRFPMGSVIYDICCGVGGDAMALAARGTLFGIDQDPAMCLLAAHNVKKAGHDQATFVSNAAETLELPQNAWVHLDPDRRSDRGRASAPDNCSPAIAAIDRLLCGAAGAAIKLAPAAEVPDHWLNNRCEREWISRGGVCRQQVVWFQPQIESRMISATRVLATGQVSTLQCREDDDYSSAVDSVVEPAEWLFDWDPAVRASGLSEYLGAALSAHSLGGPAGFFTSAELPSGEASWKHLFAAFRVLWHGPLDEKQIRRKVQSLQATALEIKVRGVDVSPENLRKRLLPSRSTQQLHPNGQSLTLLIGRGASNQPGRSQPIFAALAERMASAEGV